VLAGGQAAAAAGLPPAWHSWHMRIGILGPVEVERDGGRVDVGGTRLLALLARLAIDAGRPVSATGLADAIWGEDLPGDELHALQSLVSRLRRALGDADLIVQGAGGYRLALDPDAVDAARFERLAGEGAASLREGDCARAREVLLQALALWRGAPLAELPDQPFAATAARLQDARLAAIADRAEADIALGRAAELVGELEGLLAEHPLHERLAGQLIRALYGAGRQADALSVYERVRVRLADELGVTPSPELQETHLAVLRGDPALAPPAGDRDGGRTNLSTPLTSFVGRERELHRVGELLAEHRLLTLVGAGGAGKTRLAGEVAARWTGRGGVWLVELASVADEAAIAPAVLGSLGLRELQLLGGSSQVAASDALSHLLDALADQEMLLVLDNCEHLIAPVAQLVDRLLGACPRMRVMCTSREPLGIIGEMIVPVAPLELPAGELSAEQALMVPAVRLFADRAAAAASGFAVDEETVSAVIDICRRVDGLPLAIELAAARLRAMTLPQLAARLDDRFRLLTGGSRTAMARQRTLRAVVDWSWELLEAPERSLLTRLAVFTGGVTLEAAEAICAADPVAETEVFDLLCALVDKSLLQISGRQAPRYRMLETIREYGLERAGEAGELAGTRAAHARHFAALAIEAEPHLRRSDQLAWLARLNAEHDNLLAALRYLGESGEAALAARMVVALLWFWLLSGTRQEVLTWIEFTRAIPGQTDPLDRLLIDGVHALADAMPGEAGDADPWPDLAAVLEKIERADLSERPLLAALRPLLAIVVGRDRVLELLEQSARHPDPWVRATVPFVRVQFAENDGDLEGMRVALDESLAAFGEIGDRWGLAVTLSELSSLRLMDGDLDGAEHALEQTRALMAELGAREDNGMILLRLADVRARRGDLEGARSLLQRELDSKEHYAEEGAMIKLTLAYLNLQLGDHDRARGFAGEALDDLSALHRRPEQGHPRAAALSMAALIEIETGVLERGERLIVEAYPVACATCDMPIVATFGVALASLAARLDLAPESAEILGAAARLRGAEDHTQPHIADLTVRLRTELGGERFAECYGRGRALDGDAALARLDPGQLDPAAVGAQGQGNEDDEQDPHRQQRPQHV
jgi:predicted ATPase/DNA-binding SARP family transcriptional activator